jgi:chaperone required for assembly of F1-ATPase
MKRFLIAVEWDGKLIVKIIWAELLPITGYWSRCFDTFNSSRESQQRAARRIQSFNTAEA